MNGGVAGLLTSLQEAAAFFVGIDDHDQAELLLTAKAEGVRLDTRTGTGGCGLLLDAALLAAARLFFLTILRIHDNILVVTRQDDGVRRCSGGSRCGSGGFAGQRHG